MNTKMIRSAIITGNCGIKILADHDGHIHINFSESKEKTLLLGSVFTMGVDETNEIKFVTENNVVQKSAEDYYVKAKIDIGTDYTFKRKIVWFNAIGFLILHLAALYGLVRCFCSHSFTPFFGVFLTFIAAEGITAGAHRLYSHKSYKATTTLRFILTLLQTMAGQNCMYVWVRDHRQHHKFSDTDADPHNASRGFFFSHVGWLMSKKHPAVIAKGKTIDMSDLEADKIVMFQKKYYKTLYMIFAITIPVAIPIYFWNETFENSLFICYFLRYVFQLNATWAVNSAAHLYGTKPFDKYILPVESKFVAFISIGEGWHNYHHTFPWDYRAAEYGSKYQITTWVIDMFSKLKLAYDLKRAPVKIIEQRASRTGDGTRKIFGNTKDDERTSEKTE